jgi:hypothetical protein
MTSSQVPSDPRKPDYLKGSAGLHSTRPIAHDDRGTHVMPRYVGGHPKPVRAGQTMPDDEGFAYPELDERELLASVSASSSPAVVLSVCLMLCLTAIIISYIVTR